MWGRVSRGLTRVRNKFGEDAWTLVGFLLPEGEVVLTPAAAAASGL